MDWFQTLIKEICDELEITMNIVSKGWIIILEKGNKISFITGQKFDLNGHSLGLIMDDKYAMYEVLSDKKVPIIEYKILFRPNNNKDYAIGSNDYHIVEKYFQDHNQDIVIKANRGLSGVDVYHVTDSDKLSFYLDKTFQKNSSLSLCPFYHIKAEYRLIVFHNECLLMYGKRKALVIGDGKHSIRELLEKFNPIFFKDKLESHSYDQILENGEKYEYSWKFNLAEGAMPFSIEDKSVKKKLLDILEQLTKTINLGFCSVDIIETVDHEFLIMELNSSVSLQKYSKCTENGREITKNIYKNAIEALF